MAVGNNGKALIGLGGMPTGSGNIRRSSKGQKSPTRAADGSPAPNVWELDLSTLTVTPVTSIADSGPVNVSLRSADDGSKVCIAAVFPLALYDSATDTFLQGPGQGGLVDCAVNGTAADAINIGDVPVVQDLALDYIGRVLLTDYEKLALDNDDSAIGTLLDPQGALLFQPFSQDLILFDAHALQMDERIAMPTNIAQIGAGALALDASGLRIFALTTSGLTVIQLDSLPLAIGHVTASGSTWNVLGTGFVQGTSVAADGASLSTTFVNEQTLNVAGAPSLSSVEEITLTNPNGRSYTIAATFVR